MKPNQLLTNGQQVLYQNKLFCVHSQSETAEHTLIEDDESCFQVKTSELKLIIIREEGITHQDELDIYHKAQKIATATDLTDEEKYDMIFSDEISKKVGFDWCDPDTSYDEDVAAFMRGFDEYMQRQIIKNKY